MCQRVHFRPTSLRPLRVPSVENGLDQAIKSETDRAESAETSLSERMDNMTLAGMKGVTPIESTNGSRTIFTFAQSLASANFYFVTLNGLIQDDEDCTIDHNAGELTYVSAPPAGSKVKVYYYTPSEL